MSNSNTVYNETNKIKMKKMLFKLTDKLEIRIVRCLQFVAHAHEYMWNTDNRKSCANT